LLSISGAQADILAVETRQIEPKEHQAGRVAETLLAVIASIAVRSRLPAGEKGIRTLDRCRKRAAFSGSH
jgi:hypothetical protein